MPPERNKTAIFVSYTRRDECVIRCVTDLLRITDSPVFLDQDNITPGRKWRVAIDEALAECHTVLVFWCCHAAASEAVRAEYEYGIALQKAIVPVLMDSTPLSAALQEYQWIDLRNALSASHDSLIENMEKQLRLSRLLAGPEHWTDPHDFVRTASHELALALDSLVTDSLAGSPRQG